MLCISKEAFLRTSFIYAKHLTKNLFLPFFLLVTSIFFTFLFRPSFSLSFFLLPSLFLLSLYYNFTSLSFSLSLFLLPSLFLLSLYYNFTSLSFSFSLSLSLLSNYLPQSFFLSFFLLPFNFLLSHIFLSSTLFSYPPILSLFSQSLIFLLGAPSVLAAHETQNTAYILSLSLSLSLSPVLPSPFFR